MHPDPHGIDYYSQMLDDVRQHFKRYQGLNLNPHKVLTQINHDSAYRMLTM